VRDLTRLRLAPPSHRASPLLESTAIHSFCTSGPRSIGYPRCCGMIYQFSTTDWYDISQLYYKCLIYLFLSPSSSIQDVIEMRQCRHNTIPDATSRLQSISHLSSMKRRKARVQSIICADSSNEEDEPRPRKALYHHTVSIVSSTGMKTATSTIAGASSPTKKPAHKSGHTMTDNGHVHAGLGLEELEFMQEGYWDKWNVEHGVQDKQRVCPASVCILSPTTRCLG